MAFLVSQAFLAFLGIQAPVGSRASVVIQAFLDSAASRAIPALVASLDSLASVGFQASLASQESAVLAEHPAFQA